MARESMMRHLLGMTLLTALLFGPPSGRLHATEPKEISARDAIGMIRGYPGSVVMIYLYASFDAGSQYQFPTVNQMASQLRSRGLVVLAFSVDLDPHAVEQFLEKNPPATPPMRIVEFERGETIRLMRDVGGTFTQRLPYAALFDRTGKFVKDWTGAVNPQEYLNAMQPLLSAPGAGGNAPPRSSQQVAGLGFTVAPVPPFRVTSREPNLCVMTKPAGAGTTKGEESTFMVGSSYAKTLITDKKAFMDDRLRATGGIELPVFGDPAPITIDGIPGYENIANASDADTHHQIVIYQVVLFDDNRYYVMQGFTTPAQQKDDLPVFRTLATTFKRQKI